LIGEGSLVVEVGFAARHEDFVEVLEALAGGDELAEVDAAPAEEEGRFEGVVEIGDG
jgi:hypothetical protein